MPELTDELRRRLMEMTPNERADALRGMLAQDPELRRALGVIHPMDERARVKVRRLVRHAWRDADEAIQVEGISQDVEKALIGVKAAVEEVANVGDFRGMPQYGLRGSWAEHARPGPGW